jgi:hypothetical protein
MTGEPNTAPEQRHRDCRNLAVVDVAKGICHRTKLLVVADGTACECFELLPRCHLCGLFEQAPDPFLGTCTAVPSRPMAYPDLIAVTCEHYRPRVAAPR